MPEDDVFLCLKLFVLLYADDTVILAETSDELNRALRVYELYCEYLERLTINTFKSNVTVLIFSRGRIPHYELTLNGIPLEVVTCSE